MACHPNHQLPIANYLFKTSHETYPVRDQTPQPVVARPNNSQSVRPINCYSMVFLKAASDSVCSGRSPRDAHVSRQSYPFVSPSLCELTPDDCIRGSDAQGTNASVPRTLFVPRRRQRLRWTNDHADLKCAALNSRDDAAILAAF